MRMRRGRLFSDWGLLVLGLIGIAALIVVVHFT